MLECVSVEAYAIRGRRSPDSFDSKSVARSRAEIRAARVAVEAVSWITPWRPAGKPSIPRSHSMTKSSSSVAAGDVSQLIP
ncbi:MAG: hypothetical protein BWX98_02516 [Candidatus Aminicenantes bacterium ADurb.Bin147]|nr:MAG: hypothetical protein BWX98_02516 [Candidatus Aminicenantes bacterium ADurb.Bin147]